MSPAGKDGGQGSRDAGAAAPTGVAAAGAPAPARHLVGSFPDRVNKDSTTILNVYVSLTPEGHSEPLDVQVPEGGLTIDIIIEAKGFEIVGKRQAPLYVPANADSDIAGFRLKAVGAGAAEIYIEAFNGGTRIGALTLSAVIGADTDTAPNPRSTKGRLPTLGRRDGDAHLLLSFENGRWGFFWIDDEGPEYDFLTKTLTQLDPVIRDAVKDIQEIVREDYPIKPKAAITKLESRGTDLWKELIPAKIRSRFIKNHQQIKRLVIISSGDPFPWELFYPFQPSPKFDKGFLVEQVELCRWIWGRKPPTEIPLKRADFVIACAGELESAEEEVSAIAAMLKTWDRAIADGKIDEATAAL